MCEPNENYVRYTVGCDNKRGNETGRRNKESIPPKNNALKKTYKHVYNPVCSSGCMNI